MRRLGKRFEAFVEGVERNADGEERKADGGGCSRRDE